VVGLRLRRLISLTAVAILAAGTLGIGTVSAANPNWDIDIVAVPPTVGAGHDAGFVVTVTNDGPSQINALSVTTTALDTPDAAPTYISMLVYSTGAVAPCAIGSPQTCQIGTLEAGVSVTFTVAYAVPDGARGNFELEVAIRAGTGDTSADGPKGKSRGDAYMETESAEIGSGDFDGGFVVGDDSYQTNPNLGPRNIQSTALEGTDELVGVMIEDGISTLDECDSTADDSDCTGLFAEWSSVYVDNGSPFDVPFKVTLVVRGSAVPGGTAEEDIVVVHVLDDGSVDVIGDDLLDGVAREETCAFSGTNPVPTNAECLKVTKDGPHWRIEVWLFRNGYIRGGI
jgi:hypothetical protein